MCFGYHGAPHYHYRKADAMRLPRYHGKASLALILLPTLADYIGGDSFPFRRSTSRRCLGIGRYHRRAGGVLTSLQEMAVIPTTIGAAPRTIQRLLQPDWESSAGGARLYDPVSLGSSVVFHHDLIL